MYIDTVNSGISGDMFLASVLGLIEQPEIILEELEKLKNYLSGVSKLEIKLIAKQRSGILINQIEIDLKESKSHRTPKVLKNTLNEFLKNHQFSDLAKLYANKVLNSLIQAEAEVHGKLMDKIHLHELSSVDTLVDILGVTKALDLLGGFRDDFKIYCSKLPLGGGTINTSHGILPIPAPATSKILEKSNLIIQNGPIDSELVTPTGVALLANLNTISKHYEMHLNKISYGMGQKEFDNFLNILRIFYGETEQREFAEKKHPLQNYIESITMLETDVDDVSGEILGNFITNFEKEDILDVKIISGITKKNRTSHIIRVMCHPEKTFEIIEKMLDELGTLGVRINKVERVCIDRKTESHKILIKGVEYPLNYKISFMKIDDKKKIVNIKPEYDDLRRISNDSGLSIIKVQFFAQSQLEQLYKKDESNL